MKPCSRRYVLIALAAAAVLPSQAQTGSKGAARSTRSVPSAGFQSKAVQRSRQYGGHLNEHVGLSRSALAARASQKGMRLNFEAARLGVDGRRAGRPDLRGVPSGQKGKARKAHRDLNNFNVSSKQTSTFATGRQADMLYAQALRQHRAAIRDWLKVPPARRREFVASFDAGTRIGTVYSGKSGTYSAATKGAFYLRAAPGTNRVYPVSAKVY